MKWWIRTGFLAVALLAALLLPALFVCGVRSVHTALGAARVAAQLLLWRRGGPQPVAGGLTLLLPPGYTPEPETGPPPEAGSLDWAA